MKARTSEYSKETLNHFYFYIIIIIIITFFFTKSINNVLFQVNFVT